MNDEFVEVLKRLNQLPEMNGYVRRGEVYDILLDVHNEQASE